MSAGNARGVAAYAIATALGKALGLARVGIVAAVFGASADLDSFWIAYTLPTIIPAFLGGVITTVLVPALISARSCAAETGVPRGIRTFITVALAIAALASLFMFVGADVVVQTIAPGVSRESAALATALSRLLLPLTLVMAATGVLQAIAQCAGRYGLSAIDTFVTNTFVIAAAIVFGARFGVWSLAGGAICGTLVAGAALMWAVRDGARDFLRPTLDLKNRHFFSMIGNSWPYFISYGGTWAASLVGLAFASKLDAGSISALTFAGVIAFLPVEILANAVITVAYTQLCGDVQFGRGRVSATYSASARTLILLMAACTAILLLYATPITSILLQRRAFDQEDVSLTASTVSWLSLLLVPRAIALLNFRLLVASDRRWVQIAIGLLGATANVILTIVLAPRMGLAGVALAQVVSACLTVVLSHAAVSSLLLPFTELLPRRFSADVAFMCAAFIGVSALLQTSIPAPADQIAKNILSVCYGSVALTAAIAVGYFRQNSEIRNGFHRALRLMGRP